MLALAFCCLLAGCATPPQASGVKEPAARTTQRADPSSAEPPEAAAHTAAAVDDSVRPANAEIGGESFGAVGGPLPSPRDPPQPNGLAANEPANNVGPEVIPVPLPGAEPPRPALRSETLTLDQVLQSVRGTYPLLAVAAQERNRAAGEQLAATGKFDLLAIGSAISQPQGNYENYRYDALLRQPTWYGGDVYAGYRLGDGIFEPWYLERETEEGGEFRAGFITPLAQRRAIDRRRAGLFKANWERLAVEPAIQLELIAYLRAAGYAYWEWLAAGQAYRIAETLLKTALDRAAALEQQVAEGDIERIVLVDNQRLVLSRQAKLIEADQKLQTSAIKLSLFLRTPQGQPVVPPREALPESFPAPEPVDPGRLHSDLNEALARRPEVRQLNLLRRQLEVDLALAQNQCLPTIDAAMNASQDLGGATNSKDDKGELILEAGLIGEVPLQRREAAGASRALQAKIAQNMAKLRFARDKISAEVAAAYAAVLATYEQYQRASEAVHLNREMEAFERQKLDVGESNLLLLNLREQATADAALTEIYALLAFYQAIADLRAAIALDIALPSTGSPQT